MSGRGSGRAVTAQARAADLAHAEAVRLDEDVRLTASALSAVRERAMLLAHDSARVRALGFEMLPHAVYLAQYAAALRDQTRTRRSSAVRTTADQVRVMLERVVEMTADGDVAGELGMPLELVSTLQGGAVAGLASLARLREILDAAEPTPTVAPVPVDESRPSPPARWIVGLATRLLPQGSRARYAEEFAGELLELAAAQVGARAQIAHALRQVATIRALRRALPTAPRPAGNDRVRARHGARSVIATRFGLRDRLRDPLDRRLARHQARQVIRAQAETRRRQLDIGRRGPARARRGRGRHRR